MNEEMRTVTPAFSVLMSLYIKEKPEYFDQCMQSMVSQTVRPDEIVLVLDGPITEELHAVVEDWRHKCPCLWTVVPLEKNRGLGLALAAGILACHNELVARMDTDDIARADRFEKLLNRMTEDPSLDICGSHIIEFDQDIHDVLARRKVPLTHEEIAEYQKKRSAFNHVTVMFKRTAVLKAGNYEHCPLMEDDMLWIRMLMAGCRCANVDDDLVYVRTGDAMIDRRGGWDYFKKYVSGRKMILKTGYISKWAYYETVGIQLVVALLPTKLRRLLFLKLLRKE